MPAFDNISMSKYSRRMMNLKWIMWIQKHIDFPASGANPGITITHTWFTWSASW